MIRPLLLPLLLLTASCGNRTTKAPAPAADTNGAGMQTVVADTLPPLTTGEQRLKSDIFGPEIALTGRTIETDDIFQISEVCAICKDSLLIINTLQKSGAPLRIYSLPTMKLDTTMGRFGRGPEEYIYPKIYPYASPGYLALLIDNIKEDGKMRRITSDGRIETFATRIPVPYFKYSYTRDSQRRTNGTWSLHSDRKFIVTTTIPPCPPTRPSGRRRPAVREIGAQLDPLHGVAGGQFQVQTHCMGIQIR